MIPNPDENEDFIYHPSAFELDPDLWSDEKIFESDSSEEVIKLRKELEAYKKALDLMAEELAINKHCIYNPNCHIEALGCNCLLIENCHNKEWIKEFYIKKARIEE